MAISRKHRITIPFTPQTPLTQMIVVSLIVLFMPMSAITYAQTVQLNSVIVYEQSYQSFMLKRWQADRQEYVLSTRKKWWYYLPTVGYTLRYPSVSFNTGTLVQIDHDRTVMSARLSAMDARYRIEFAETVQRIRREYTKLQIRITEVDADEKMAAMLARIQAIHDEALRQQTMTPEEHLRNSYTYERAMSELRRRETELRLAVMDFFVLCRYELPDTPFVEVVSDFMRFDEEARRKE